MLLTKWVMLPCVPCQISGPVPRIMRRRIIRIGKLIEDGAAPLGPQFFCEIPGRLHAPGAWRENQLGTECTHTLATLDTLVFRHDQDHAITTHGRRHRQGNARITAGRLDQGITRPDFTTRLCAKNHRQRRPILDRARRIVTLELDQQPIVAALVIHPWDALQPYQRRTANIMFQCIDEMLPA